MSHHTGSRDDGRDVYDWGWRDGGGEMTIWIWLLIAAATVGFMGFSWMTK